MFELGCFITKGVQASTQSANPEAISGIVVAKGITIVVTQACWVIGDVSVHFAAVPIGSIQTLAGGNPQKSPRVLRYGVDLILSQA